MATGAANQVARALAQTGQRTVAAATKVARQIPPPSPTNPGLAVVGLTGAPNVENTTMGAARTIRLVGLPNGTPANIAPPRNFTFWFPVAPTVITKSGTLNRNVFSVVMGGERAHAAGPTLGTISFDSFFPGPVFDPRICKALRSDLDFLDPVVACQLLEYLRDSGSVVTLNFGSGEINETVQITDFSWTETAGRPFDRQFSITLGMWEPEVVKVRGGVRLPPLPKVYVVREGETLSDVALRMYGDTKKWRQIQQANPALQGPSGASPTQGLTAGETLNIPRELNLSLMNPDWVQFTPSQ